MLLLFQSKAASRQILNVTEDGAVISKFLAFNTPPFFPTTILVSSYQYIDSSGSAIQCLFEKGTDIPANVINRYCWIMSTFTLPQHYEGTAGEDFIHFGVGKCENYF